MSFNANNDIILGVVRAADPGRYQAALQKLKGTGVSAFAETASMGGENFSETVRRLGVGGGAGSAALGHFPVSLPATSGLISERRVQGTDDVMRQYEALYLQNAIESALPREADSVYGKGFAGGVWKSFLAQYIAQELSRTDKIGIANVLKHHATNKGVASL